MKTTALFATAALVAALATPGLTLAADNKITPLLEEVEVTHNGEKVVISRGHDRDATLPEVFQKTDRGCPPFCVEPMTIVPGVDLARASQGDASVLIVDSRTPEWVVRGTIPGSVNIPWNKINIDQAGTFETPAEADTLEHILADDFGAKKTNGGWDFSDAKTLVLFCNGIWCPQSSTNIKTLVGLGYPVHKLKWYRGGMQDWVSVGLTTVKP
jgi:rhodanese-related sulfurtransferase